MITVIIDDKRSIMMFHAYNAIINELGVRIGNLKKGISNMDGLELEETSRILFRLINLWNGLVRILEYDDWNGSFADLIIDEIQDQNKYLKRLLAGIRSPLQMSELLDVAGEIGEASLYIVALKAISDGNVDEFLHGNPML